MRTIRILVVMLALTLLLPATTAANPASVTLRLIKWASGFTNPVALAFPPPNGRSMIVEQRGVIKVRDSSGTVRTWLDIRSKVSQDGGERGLLGLAFPANYASTGYFFVYYTLPSGANRVSRFRSSPPTAPSVSSSTEYVILTISHPTYANHNGGQLQFGHDGYLYIGTGDGGSGGDPSGNAQNLRSLLGKLLRIDVSRSCGSIHYCNPRTNPYFSSSTAKHEIWDYGLRNPWRFSFDRANWYLYIGDVGQGSAEEIDYTSNSRGGINWGWDCYEGRINTVSTYGGSYCSGRSFQLPIYTYGHSGSRCAIIGGYRYRGTAYPALYGMYVYADYCSSEINLLEYVSGKWTNSTRLTDTGGNITSFGEARNGELFMVDTGGNFYQVATT